MAGGMGPLFRGGSRCGVCAARSPRLPGVGIREHLTISTQETSDDLNVTISTPESQHLVTIPHVVTRCGHEHQLERKYRKRTFRSDAAWNEVDRVIRSTLRGNAKARKRGTRCFPEFECGTRRSPRVATAVAGKLGRFLKNRFRICKKIV